MLRRLGNFIFVVLMIPAVALAYGAYNHYSVYKCFKAGGLFADLCSAYGSSSADLAWLNFTSIAILSGALFIFGYGFKYVLGGK